MSSGKGTSRYRFVRQTYLHLLGAIVAFVALSVGFRLSGFASWFEARLQGIPWLLILGAFVLVAWMARKTARRARKRPIQYLALGVYVLAEALLFVPLLIRAEASVPGVTRIAAFATVGAVVLLTALAMLWPEDLSRKRSLRVLLRWGSGCALLLIVCALLFDFHLGVWFSIAMVALGGGAVLSDSSGVLRGYRRRGHVAAALALFASIGLLFWYTLRLSRRVLRIAGVNGAVR